MRTRRPRFRWSTFIALVATLTAGCTDDEPTAPGLKLKPGGGIAQSVTYTNGNVTMTDLGTLSGGVDSYAMAINNSGTIAGFGRTTQEPPCWNLSTTCTLSVMWASYGSTIVSHDYLTQCYGPTTSYSRGINNAGAIVGSGQCYWSFVHYGFVRDPSGTVRQLTGIADYNSASDINDNGIVVGYANVGGCEYPGPLYGNASCERAARWDVNGPTITVTNLGDPPGGYRSYANAINNAGTIVGHKYNASNQQRAFVSQAGGPLTDIGALPGDNMSDARGVSENGVVVGYSIGANIRAFWWTQGAGMQPLGTLGGASSYAYGVNDDGIIVGTSHTASGQLHAFAYNAGVMVDLGVLPGYSTSEAYAINASGEIVGRSFGPGGYRAVRWTVSFPGATPTGTGVNVQPIDVITGDPAPVELTFDNVTGGGATSVSSAQVGQGAGPPPPAGFRLGNPPTYYDVVTTATFTGQVTLCFDYSGASYGNENKLKLLHFENGAWTNVTTSLDTNNNIICGTVTSLSPFLVAEENEAPVVTGIALPAAPVPVGTPMALTASFTDANPGDAHIAYITWDDGTTTSGGVGGSPGAGLVGDNHTFTAPGVYTVSVRVSDGELEGARSSSSDQPSYIVIYDPSSGFVTGGGWFNSPAGACTWSGCAADGSTTGKASFGFVSRYAKGANTPSGTTEFMFKAGGLAFSSTSYQWLVIAGKRAQYKGTGVIEGSSRSYGFLITAIDGDQTPGIGSDQFRIKIWDTGTGTVVYDNRRGESEDSDAATTIFGGKIVIHK